MPVGELAGYAGQILRIVLTSGNFKTEFLTELKLKKYMGGATLGIRFVFDEVPDGTEWNAPQNIIFLSSTPLDGVAAGIGILPHWDKMLRNYYRCMGWGEKTGCTLPETLKLLGLVDVIDFLPSPPDSKSKAE